MRRLLFLLLLVPAAAGMITVSENYCRGDDIKINLTVAAGTDVCHYYITPPGQGERQFYTDYGCKGKNITWPELNEITSQPYGAWGLKVIAYDQNATTLSNETESKVFSFLYPLANESWLLVPPGMLQEKTYNLSAHWYENCTSNSTFEFYLSAFGGEWPIWNGTISRGASRTVGFNITVPQKYGRQEIQLRYRTPGYDEDISVAETILPYSYLTIEDFKMIYDNKAEIYLRNMGVNKAVVKKIDLEVQRVDFTLEKKYLNMSLTATQVTEAVQRSTVSIIKVVPSLKKMILASEEVKHGDKTYTITWDEPLSERNFPPDAQYKASIKLSVYDDVLQDSYDVEEVFYSYVLDVCGNGICGVGECGNCPGDCELDECVDNGPCTFPGENCDNSPGDCGCAEGLECKPADAGADKRGCIAKQEEKVEAPAPEPPAPTSPVEQEFEPPKKFRPAFTGIAAFGVLIILGFFAVRAIYSRPGYQ